MKSCLSLLLICLAVHAGAQQPEPGPRLPMQRLRTGLFGWTQGLVPVELEQRIGRKFSASLITGLTVHSPTNELFAGMRGDGNVSPYFPQNNAYSSEPRDYNDRYSFRHNSHRRARIGYQAGLDFYFYPRRNASRESFIGLGAVYRRFNSRSEKVDPDRPAEFSFVDDGFPRLAGVYQDESIRALDYLLSIGTTSHWQSHFCLTIRFQVGVRTQTATMQDLGQVLKGNNTYGINAIQQFSAVRPVFGLDLLLGGWR